MALITRSSLSRQEFLAAALSLTLFQTVWASGPIPLPGPQAADASDTSLLAVNDPTLPVVVWNLDLTRALVRDGSLKPNNDEADAPTQELVDGLNVQITHTRRKFRSRVVSWLTERSAPAGMLGDLLLGGADSGWHVVVSTGGSDEYMLEWKTKFH